MNHNPFSNKAIINVDPKWISEFSRGIFLFCAGDISNDNI